MEPLLLDVLSPSECELKDLPLVDPRSLRRPYRLISVETGSLVNFTGSASYAVEYGIMSHVWLKGEDEEATWDDLNGTSVSDLQKYLKELGDTGSKLDRAWRGKEIQEVERLLDKIESVYRVEFRLSKEWVEANRVEALLERIKKKQAISNSLRKLENALKVAGTHGLKYLWVDTCCMNKSSSSELTKSICCMAEWYSNAKLCFIYLGDVGMTSFSELHDYVKDNRLDWATRSWTLQEIAMCNRALFYNKNWEQIGSTEPSKNDICIAAALPEKLVCTGGRVSLAAAFVMGYAAERDATRKEDKAYSLMGLLGVKMPILYGEGEEAAISRLIDEVIRSTGDISVFYWYGEGDGSRRPGKSLYPSSMKAYKNGTYMLLGGPVISRTPVTMSNAGVDAALIILPTHINFGEVYYDGGLVGLMDDVLKEREHYKIYCDVFFSIPRPPDEGMAYGTPGKLRCPLSVLKRQVEYAKNLRLLNPNPPTQAVPGSWVLAKFPASDDMRWFLCLLERGLGSTVVGWRVPSSIISLMSTSNLQHLDTGETVRLYIR